MRRKNEAMRDELIKHAKDIYEQEGIDALNIRSLAKHSGVASGTIYNYFSGKDEILMAVTEKYWQSALDDLNKNMPKEDFTVCIEYMHRYINERVNTYGMLLMYSLKDNGLSPKSRMISMQNEYRLTIIRLLNKDNNIKNDIWTDSFTKEAFSGFVMKNIILLLKADKKQFNFFLELIRRILY